MMLSRESGKMGMVPHMPALVNIEESFWECQPLVGWSVLIHMHLTKETMQLGNCLRAGGASIYYWPSNRNPTDPWIVERVLADEGQILHSLEDLDALTMNSDQCFLVVEGNGRIFSLVHDETRTSAFAKCVKGISEHTSGGGNKVDRFDAAHIRVPVVAVYRDPLKYEIETGLGTSQSTIGALIRGLQAPVAGRQVLVVGYGRVGSGLARSLAALGARVLVSEKNPERCLLARLAGFRLVSIEQGITTSDLCLTATGTPSVLSGQILERCRDGLKVANVSNVPKEIDTSDCIECEPLAEERVLWRTRNGKRFEVLGGGLQINHVLGSGNSSELMDLSLSLHALVIKWLIEEEQSPSILSVPDHIRDEVASHAFLQSCQSHP